MKSEKSEDRNDKAELSEEELDQVSAGAYDPSRFLYNPGTGTNANGRDASGNLPSESMIYPKIN